MEPSPKTNQVLHEKLPIDNDETILGIYKHHWFAYVSVWFITILLVICIFGVAVLLTAGSDSAMAQYRGAILAGAAFFGLIVVLAGLVPIYLRSKEQLVLTEEALLQVLQPTLFASKVDQLGLQRIDDVSVHQDFFGTIFGYGKLTVETPGEQDNYEFVMVPKPQLVARAISSAHENFEAALQGGRLSSTLGDAPQAQGPQINAEEFQQFLEFQQMQKMQKQQSGAQPEAANTINQPGDTGSNEAQQPPANS